MRLYLDHFLDGAWQTAACLDIADRDRDKGRDGPLRLSFVTRYVIDHQGRPEAELLPGQPLELDPIDYERWPEFLIDLLPQGVQRERVLNEVGFSGRTGRAADVAVLERAPGNPPGHLRIREAAPEPPTVSVSQGFPREAILERGPDLLDHMRAHNMPTAGSTDAGGETPKFLLTQAHNGLWFADGALPDREACGHYLVKFPASSRSDARSMLYHEAVFLRVASRLGLDVHGEAVYERDTLFVPRFDREVDAGGSVRRHAQVSLYAVMGRRPAEGRPESHEAALEAMAPHVPEEDLIAYVKRDMLNLALGNPDNHGRNTALLRSEWGWRLAPLYDLAPMEMDPRGIPRRFRWAGETANTPDWSQVRTTLAQWVDESEVDQELAAFGEQLEAIPKLLAEEGAEQAVIDQAGPRSTALADAIVPAFDRGAQWRW